MTDRHAAIRTCIGCRGQAPRASLVRYAYAVGSDDAPRVVRDDAARFPGRGAWVHDDEGCRERARKRRALGRALRRAGAPGIEFPEHRHGDTDGAGHVVSSPTRQEERGGSNT